jgi:hypothetical protein
VYAWEINRATIELCELRQEEWVRTSLAEAAVSPLFNEALPADDAGARVRQIRAGFKPRSEGRA